MRTTPAITPAAALAVLALAQTALTQTALAQTANTQTTAGPQFADPRGDINPTGPDTRLGFEPIDLRVDTRFDGTPTNSATLIAPSGTAITTLLPRTNLNSNGGAAAGIQFVIGELPGWLARQHGLIAADQTPPPPTMLDRLIRPMQMRARINTHLAAAPAATTPLPPESTRTAVSLGRDLSVASLLQTALNAERAAATPNNSGG